ncbi:MAG: hypothetical protein QMB51_03350 [Patescibacteria group bacterium]
MNKNIIITITLVALVGGGSFFGGIQVGKSQSKSKMPNFQNMQGSNFSRNGQNSTTRKNLGMGGNMVSGQILSLEGNTLTVKLQTGGSKIVLLSDNTKVLKSTDATKEELLTDKNITVTGKTNNDGTVTAETIQIRSDISNNTNPKPSINDKQSNK